MGAWHEKLHESVALRRVNIAVLVDQGHDRATAQTILDHNAHGEGTALVIGLDRLQREVAADELLKQGDFASTILENPGYRFVS